VNAGRLTFPNSPPVVNVEVLGGGGVYLHDDLAALYGEKISLLDRLALSSAESLTRSRAPVEEIG
jgi:hypothetical protein